MEINKINSAINTEMGTSKSKGQATVVPEFERAAPRPELKIVSDDWQLISSAQPELDQLNEIDSDRVAEIRQSLIDGSFDLDLDQIADAMLNQHG